MPISVKACSPPIDGSSFTCPSNDFNLVRPTKNKFVEKPIYKNTFGWTARTIIKKLNNYELEQKKQLVKKMISKALMDYQN